MSSPFPVGSRLVAYCRDSGGREQDVSVERQRAEILAWALDSGLVITRWFEDRARSGGSTARRDAFLELTDYLSEAHRPEIGVVIWEYARFARQFDDAVFYVASLRRLGYQVYSITDAIPDTLEGRLLESILAWKNAKYREDLSRAVRSGMHLVLSSYQGYPNRTPPFGYQKEFVEIGKRRDGSSHRTARLIPDPATAPLLQSAFELRARGATYAEIHNALHLTAHHVSLNRILTNPIYTGTLVYGGNEYPNFCPPLVSAETFSAANAVNRARAGKFGYNHPRRARSRFLLTGLLFCAWCGSPMNGRVAKRKGCSDKLYYVCRNSNNGKAATCRAPAIPKETIEKMVLDDVSEHLLHPDVLKSLLRRYSKRKTRITRPSSLDRLRSDLSRNDAELHRLVDAIREAGHSRALLDELGVLEQRHDALVAQVNASEASTPKPLQLDPTSLEHALTLLNQKLHSSDPVECVTVLRGLVAEVSAKRDGGTSIRHRGGPVTGEITLLVPISGESLIVPL